MNPREWERPEPAFAVSAEPQEPSELESARALVAAWVPVSVSGPVAAQASALEEGREYSEHRAALE